MLLLDDRWHCSREGNCSSLRSELDSNGNGKHTRTQTKTQLNLTAHVSRLVVAADSSQDMFWVVAENHKLFSVLPDGCDFQVSFWLFTPNLKTSTIIGCFPCSLTGVRSRPR